MTGFSFSQYLLKIKNERIHQPTTYLLNGEMKAQSISSESYRLLMAELGSRIQISRLRFSALSNHMAYADVPVMGIHAHQWCSNASIALFFLAFCISDLSHPTHN